MVKLTQWYVEILLLRLTSASLNCRACVCVCDTADDAKFDGGLLAFTLRSSTHDTDQPAGRLMFAMNAPY